MRFICQKLGRGGILWTKDYQWHRSDGPAFVGSDGLECYWWKDDRLWPDQERRWWERER